MLGDYLNYFFDSNAMIGIKIQNQSIVHYPYSLFALVSNSLRDYPPITRLLIATLLTSAEQVADSLL